MGTPELLQRLRDLSERRTDVVYDLRGECQVYGGVIAPYRGKDDAEGFATLGDAVHHALENDGIVEVRRDAQGQVVYHSCRLFTDEGLAVRFAREQDQLRVLNLNRGNEVVVTPETHLAAAHPDPYHSGRSMEAA